MSRLEFPERYFPGDDLGIPWLLPELQGEIVPPICCWGSRSRQQQMGGTWVFYTQDYRFRALMGDPEQVGRTGAVAAAEINVSLFDHTPAVLALWATYQKRLAARYWQGQGVGILVDLNVPERHLELSMRGVPDGWKAFATRGYAARPEALLREVEFAERWGRSGTRVLVYGGGKKIQDLCAKLKSVVWVPDARSEAKVNRPALRAVRAA